MRAYFVICPFVSILCTAGAAMLGWQTWAIVLTFLSSGSLTVLLIAALCYWRSSPGADRADAGPGTPWRSGLVAVLRLRA